MRLEESARLYLADYYLLEQARDGANRFLKEIGEQLAFSVREQLNQWPDSPVKWGEWVQKGGGALSFWVITEELPSLERFGSFKYSVDYNDAMRADGLSDSTYCRVFGTGPKSSSAAAAEIRRVAKSLGLPDPYGSRELGLLDAPADEVVARLTEAFMEHMDAFTGVVRALERETKRS